jgi:predicted nucleic acid-binding protein
MALVPHGKPLALDTNILFDLAEELDSAHDFRETFQQAGYGLWIPPTVVQELAFESDAGDTLEDREIATKALQNISRWGIVPYDLVSVGHGLTDAFAERLLRKGLLPENEYHDGLILAETSLVRIPVLVTCDKHLLDIDDAILNVTFDECDLFHVRPCHPKLLLRAIR